MNNLAIIPARGGSKRIPKKNIKNFLGKPIIAYSIETGLNSKLFSEVMVSTDSEEIAEISRRYGAKTPFLRSKANSSDTASTVDVIHEVLTWYKHEQKKTFDFTCCIYPAAPLITVESLESAYNLIISKNFDSVFPIVKYNYPIQRALKLDNGKIKMRISENLFTRTQDLKDSYHDAGQFYWIKNDIVLKEKNILTDNAGAIVLSELDTQDIDNPIDWQLAEIKFKLNL